MANIKDIRLRVTLDNSQAKRGIQGIQNQVSGLERAGKASLLSLQNAFKTLVGAQVIRSIVQLGDALTSMRNRITAVTGSQEEANRALSMVSNIARRTRSDIEAVADLYTNLTVATADMGVSQEDVARMTETFSKTLKVSGADAAAASGAIRQFGQAMASGVLRGDEFNSIMEANPIFMRKLAEAVQEPIGALRELAADGVLTADIIALAIQEMETSVNEDFGKTTATVSESLTMMRNEFISLGDQIEQKTGIFAGIANAIKTVSDNLDVVAQVMAIVFGYMAAVNIYKVVSAIYAMATALRAAAVSGALLQGITGVGLAKIVAGLTGAGGAVWALNQYMDSQEEAIAQQRALADEMANMTIIPITGGRTTPPSGSPAPGSAAAALDAAQAATEEEKRAKRLGTQILQNIQSLKDLQAQQRANLDNILAQYDVELELYGLGDRAKSQQREIAELEANRRKAIEEIKALQLDPDPINNQLMQNDAVFELNTLYNEQIRLLREKQLADQEAATAFSTGWSEAFNNWQEQVNDNATYGKNLFDTMINGWSDAFVKFAETGKLSFKDLFRSLMAEIVRMQANKLFLSLFGGGGIFGSFFSDIFGGARANGGPVTANRPYLIGEKGPEMFVPNSSGTVVPNNALGGMTHVTYNINAVDALSFKQMIAADPEFIFNVSRRGSRRYV